MKNGKSRAAVTAARFDRMRLLLIEDQPDTRNMMRDMLTQMGVAHITEAANGREGLDVLLQDRQPVDAVLCDWNLPLLDGIDVLRRMHNHHIRIPFLMVTGRGDADSVAQAKDAGASAYIRKPFSPNQLEAKLRLLHHQFRL